MISQQCQCGGLELLGPALRVSCRRGTGRIADVAGWRVGLCDCQPAPLSLRQPASQPGLHHPRLAEADPQPGIRDQALREPSSVTAPVRVDIAPSLCRSGRHSCPTLYDSDTGIGPEGGEPQSDDSGSTVGLRVERGATGGHCCDCLRRVGLDDGAGGSFSDPLAALCPFVADRG